MACDCSSIQDAATAAQNADTAADSIFSVLFQQLNTALMTCNAAKNDPQRKQAICDALEAVCDALDLIEGDVVAPLKSAKAALMKAKAGC